MPLQLPPAVGSSGQFVETVIVTSSQQRHVMVIGDGVSTAYGPLTSSGGLLVALSNPSTAVTVTNAATTAVNVANSPTVLTASSGYLVRSLSSGTVTLSSNPTVILSSIPSLSSGTVTLSSSPLIIAASSAGHQVGSLTSGTVTLSSAIAISSGTFTLSSAPLVIVATSGGTIPVTLSTVFSLSSNPTVVSASSGVIQLSSQITVATTGTLIIVSASSGVVQVLQSTGTAGGVTSTYFVLTTTRAIKTAAGRLMGYSAYATALTSAGQAPLIVFYNLTTGNVVVGTSQTLVTPIQVFTTGTATSLVDITPLSPSWFGPNGLDFNTAISVNSAITATGIAHATNVYMSAFYV